MPASTNSRRKQQQQRSHRRQNSEDIEVDNNPTQTQQQADDVESDDDGAAPRARKNKSAGKGKKQKKTQASDDEDGDDEEGGAGDDDDDIIDVNAWKDQPLPKDEAKALQGLAMDWNLSDKMIRQNWEVVEKIGVGLVDAADDGDEPEEIEELDKIMRELVDIGAKFQSNRAALEELHQKVVQGNQVDDAQQLYEDGVIQRNEKYEQKTTRQKYSKVQEYVQFKTALWEATNPGSPMPPLTDFIKKEAGDNEDSDDDLEIGGKTQDYKCPISLTLLTDPLTSTVCNHSYSALAIRSSFQGRSAGHSIACPTAGCKKYITLAQCKPNPQLAKKAKAYGRRIARQEAQEHSDAESIVD